MAGPTHEQPYSCFMSYFLFFPLVAWVLPRVIGGLFEAWKFLPSSPNCRILWWLPFFCFFFPPFEQAERKWIVDASWESALMPSQLLKGHCSALRHGCALSRLSKAYQWILLCLSGRKWHLHSSRIVFGFLFCFWLVAGAVFALSGFVSFLWM